MAKERHDYDAIVVGGGHNGLTTAGYLAKAGLKTLVLERRGIVGGASVTQDICPGFRISTLSYVCSLLNPQVIEDLELERLGFEVLPMGGTMMIAADGRELLMTPDLEQQQRAIAQYSNGDFAALQKFRALIGEAAGVVRGQWLREPPPLGGVRASDSAGVLQMGLDLRRTGAEARQMLVRAMVGSARQIIERTFTNDTVRLYHASNVVIGNFASLDAPASAMSMLRIGMMLGNNRPWGVAKGGMGAITQAMAAFVREKGGDIRTAAPVAKILVENGTALGVRLDGGEEIRARVVAANTDPRRTFLGLVGEEHLPADFAADMRGYRMGTASFKINLALKGLPRYGQDKPGVMSDRHRALVNMVDSWAGIDESYRNAAAGIPGNPATVQMLIPSVFDDSLAPAGQHVASLACKYFPYDLADGKSWNDIGEEVGTRILAWVERFVPGLGALVVGRQFITPLDLEQEYGLSRGCIHHGRLDPDQIWNMRPHPDAAQYRTPIKNLYLCGSGAHPGGGVTGAPGHNAARRMLKDVRKRA